MQVKKQQLELDRSTHSLEQTGSKLGEEYIKAIYCHPAYLYSEYIIRNTRLESKLVREITTSDCR
jgi:hypothetical protein